MYFVDDIILCTIYLLFPITLYYFYVAYNKKIETKESNLFLGFALFSSLYLMIFKGSDQIPRTALIMTTIPILLAYIKNQTTEGIILSVMYILAVNYVFQVDIRHIIIQFVLYFIIYMLLKKYRKKYLFITCIFLLDFIMYMIFRNSQNCIFNDKYFNDKLYFSIPIIYVVCIVIVYIVDLGENIIRYHMHYKELIHEKQIKDSLFKITHEIKNPIAVCKGYLEMLNIDNKEQCKKYIPIIRSEIEHTLTILQDFSSFSKITIKKDCMDLNYLIGNVINSMSDLFKINKIKIKYKEKNEIYINADYDRLNQVFINIFKNCIEALEERKNKKIDVELSEDDRSTTVLISDNGIGMSIECMNKIFQPFYTTKKNGTGLGTLLSKEIISAHKGTIEYSSKEDIGTTVKIIIPKK